MKAVTEGETKHFYEFGPFRVDPTKRLLLRDGTPQPLTPKAFDILLVLVRRGDQVVEKDELMRAVWPDTVVEENNLTRNISALRKALGEGPHDHSYVVTVPGRGYTFVAGVKDLADEPADLLVAKYTRTHLVVEEEELEETRGRGDTETRRIGETVAQKQDFRQDFPVAASPLPRVSVSSLKLLVLSAIVALSVALAYFWISDRSRRVDQTRSGVSSVAVLPFKMIGAESGNEYLGVGMADALITRLGNIRAVVVRPTSAMRKYIGPGGDPVAAGREQGVEAVLEGSVQRVDDRIRVTVQLVSVASGMPLWTGKFDEKFTSIFAVQDSISEQVARALVPELTGDEEKLLTRRHTENTEAYQLYMKGRYFWNKRTPEGHKRAIEHFQQAIEKDPNYAQAFAGLADSSALLGPLKIGAVPRREVMLKVKAAALKALELDETLAEAHTSLAFVLMHYDWNWSAAEKEFKRAIELNPNYATAHHWYAYNLITIGRMDEAVAEIKRAQELDPLSLIINTDVGEILYYARRYDEAIEQSRKTLELDSNFVLARRVLAWTYLQKGMHKEAIAELQQMVDISGSGTDSFAWLAHAYAVAGKRAEARDALNKLKMQSKQSYVASINMAMIYMALDEKDQAFAWLERVHEERDGVLILLKVWPSLDPLRSDPRFAGLLRRVGLAS